MPLIPACIEPVSEITFAQPRPRWTAKSSSGTAGLTTSSTFLKSVTTGADCPAVTLKKPPTLTWPLLSVVAEYSIASRTPVDRPFSRMSNAVTAAIAAPRKNDRRACCVRLR